MKRRKLKAPDTMYFMANFTKLSIILCGVTFFTDCGGIPIKRRAVGEMQLMHNYGDFVHSLQRQDWLELQLQSLYTASMSTPQEFTPKVTESKPQKPLKKENRPKQVPHLSQRVNPKTSHRHGVKPNANNFLKPDIP